MSRYFVRVPRRRAINCASVVISLLRPMVGRPLSGGQTAGPAESNSVCLAPNASRARRRVGDLWGEAGILAAGPVRPTLHL
jgi:hypothetical protein